MIIACPSCNSKYKFDEKKFEGSFSKKVKCPKCKFIMEVVNENLGTSAGNLNPDAMERTYSSVPEASSSVVKGSTDPETGPATQEVRRDALLAEAKVRTSGDEHSKMPELRRFSLAVIQGNNAGEIYQINKPKMIIGRSDADVIVKDLEASRQHARIEVIGDRVVLRDLNSTNGTFVNEQKISFVNLENQAEFRIGTTILMLIITDVE